jgi:dTDP-4-dehydrorhamnose 3,5-epimerase
MLKWIDTKLEGVKRLQTPCFHDERGYFMETFSQKNLNISFCQDNLSFSKQAGTLRGLHFQTNPHAQGKLVSVPKGSILDVAVDLRRSSKTFGDYVTCILSADNKEQLFIPIGFAHGFITLEPDTLVAYKVTSFYSKEHDRGILWSDPDLNIPWPSFTHPPILSAKDLTLPRFRDLQEFFV